MADGLYIGMAGAAARSAQLDAIADNLANAQTPGFKASRPAFQSFLPEGVQASDKVATAAVSTGVDLRTGVITVTGERLDVVPEDDAFLAVRMPAGNVAYTRAGRLSVDADGQLRAAGGLVLGRSGEPLAVPPGSTPEISRNGNVTVQGQTLDSLGLFRMDGPVRRMGGSLLAPDAGGQALPVESGVRVGELELGNAPALEAAVEMISAQRNFETSTQALQVYRRLDEKSSEIGRIR